MNSTTLFKAARNIRAAVEAGKLDTARRIGVWAMPRAGMTTKPAEVSSADEWLMIASICEARANYVLAAKTGRLH